MLEIGKIKIIKNLYTVYVFDDYKELNKKNQEIDQFAVIRPEKLKEDEGAYGVDGFISYSNKIICIYVGPNEDVQAIKHTITHEIYHGILFEMGYSYYNDEEFVERLAHLSPIGNELFNEVWNMYSKDSKESEYQKFLKGVK